MSNHLGGESSPYLRQHVDDPVAWYPWGPDAFAEAHRRDRPLLISIGYSTCHWCNVMARESFSDPDTADILNQLFVPVLVDRQERPDVDAFYLDAARSLTGNGGWPMTIFALPDGRPFLTGTYFPRVARPGATTTLVEVCLGVDALWRTDRSSLERQGDETTRAVAEFTQVTPAAAIPTRTAVDAAVRSLVASADPAGGGFGREAKFPQATAVDLLLRAWQRSGDPEVGEVVTTTLDAMASGGIVDHLSGGFARYTSDRAWRIPRFEKLLVDQAMVARLYLHAHQLTGRPHYRQVLDEIVAYVDTTLGLPGGGYAAAEGADDDGEEGGYWTWPADEFDTTLADGGLDPMEVATARLWWGVTDEGILDGRNVLWRPRRGDLIRPPVVERARRLLLARRRQRAAPALDDQVITEWNAWWVSALAEAALALDQPRWADRAVDAGRFLVDHLRGSDGRWLRTWHADGGAHHPACAGDLAALVDAFTRLSELTGDPSWLGHGSAAVDELLRAHWDEDAGGLFTTSGDAPSLVPRTKDLADSAMPSANGAAAVALVRLGALTAQRRATDAGAAICRLVGDLVTRYPTGFTHLLTAVELLSDDVVAVVVTGERPDLVRAAAGSWRPHVVLAWGTPWDSPLWAGRQDDHPGRAYVCRDGTCGPPAERATALAEQLAATTPALPTAAVDDLAH